MTRRGIFEKAPGSGDWWIRYADCTGRIRREKAETWVSARDLYIKRKAEVLQGRKLPERLRQRPISFREIADDAVAYIKQEYARPADDVARVEVVREWFGERAAASITREEVKSALNSPSRKTNGVSPLGTTIKMFFPSYIASPSSMTHPKWRGVQ